MKSWKDEVVGTFGVDDCKFAVHATEEGSARAMIKKAKAAGASLTDVEKEIVYHCFLNVGAPELLKDHTEAQIKKLRSMW